MERKSLQCSHLPPAGHRRRFRLRPTAGGLRQVGINSSQAAGNAYGTETDKR